MDFSIFRKHWLVFGVLMGVGLFSALVSSRIENSNDWLSGFLSNMATEMFGAFITFVLLEGIVGGAQKREEKAQLEADEKARLILALGSKINYVAKKAAEELRFRGWLQDGSLMYANLEGANLQEADLRNANLQMAKLWWANLQRANLQRANLGEADLLGAILYRAILYRAILYRANLQGANLQGDNLKDAYFDGETILPNGKKWTPDTDMSMFTDPSHSDFWKPS